MKGKLLSPDWEKKAKGFHAAQQHCATVWFFFFFNLFFFCLAGSRRKLEPRAGKLEGQMEPSSDKL